MTLPSFRVGGPTTKTVGFFDYGHRRFAEWLVDRLGRAHDSWMRTGSPFKCRAIRAVRVEDDEYIYPARVIEVFGPDGEPPVGIERSIVAANDGGRWVFETSGTPHAFEDQEAYKKRRKSHRFTGEMLHTYLLALGVPADSEPDCRSAFVVETETERRRT